MLNNPQRGSGLLSLVARLVCTALESAAQSLRRYLQSSESSTLSETKKPASNGWCFYVRIDGEDLVCDNCTATWFGGCDDELDNGQTASGVPTCGNPDLLGCALPVVPNHPSTAGSPLAFRPRIPWKTSVEVTYRGKTITVPLLDNGPAKSSGDAIDLTLAAFKQFEPLKVGVLKGVSFRVVGAARFAQANARTNSPTPG